MSPDQIGAATKIYGVVADPVGHSLSPVVHNAALAAAGWVVGNIDATIVAQAPKMAPHIPAMVARLAEVLQLHPGQINVKAKTAEKMGPVGEGRSIETRAVCLLVPRPGVDSA